MLVLERAVSDHTKALIDFDKGSSVVDTLRGCNALELSRVLKCVEDVDSRTDLLLDSLVITASCSPEGAYKLNQRLSLARSQAVLTVLEDCIPEHMRPLLRTSCMAENWSQMAALIRNDTIISRNSRDRITRLIDTMDDPDRVEYKLSSMPDYRYLREKIYPQLRSVSFDFYLHRKGMVKDTVHTTVVDSVYMSGIEALKDMNYNEAVRILRPYADYNSALAYTSSGYNHSALGVLESLSGQDPKVLYLMAMVLSRLEKQERAMECFTQALELSPSLEFRANLDPEMSELVRKWNKTRRYDEF
jgi:hypothetical protein